MTKSTYRILAIALLLVLSCNKDGPKQCLISDEFKTWTVFYQGSLGIFQNDLTLETDSVFVKTNPKFPEVHPAGSNDDFTLEYMDMSYTSSFFAATTIMLKQISAAFIRFCFLPRIQQIQECCVHKIHTG